MQFTIAALAAFVASTTALGINCRGGAFCTSNGAGGTLRNLKDIVDGISDRGRSYSTGQQIACSGSLCAFYQNGATGTAQQTSDFIQDLLNRKHQLTSNLRLIKADNSRWMQPLW